MVFVHIVLCVTIIIICERVVRRERDHDGSASAMIGEAVFVARVWRCGAILANHVSDATSAQ